MINVRGLQRNVKNVVKNYTDAQVKVREATSNDPWGPPSSLMAEIADLTYNVVAASEIMQMIWKRLNDHGKNWRHVYKALSLLDYLIKTGSEKVAQQCRENIFAIQTLKDFQYIEENKDQGLNVREKSKALVALLKDEEKLKTERTRALKAKERFAQSVSYMSNSASMETLPKTSTSYHEGLNSNLDKSNVRTAANVNNELEQARPQTIGEEELQLQLALAMSKEEAEANERQRKNDALRLKLALTESEKEKKKKNSALDDLLSIDLAGPSTTNNETQLDLWNTLSTSNDNLNTTKNGLDAFGAVGGSANNDPWNIISPTLTNLNDKDNDPWSPKQMNAENNLKNSSLSNNSWQSTTQSVTPINNDPWMPNNSDVNKTSVSPTNMQVNNNISSTRTPESFLGLNLNLVNLDALVTGKNSNNVSVGSNPFAFVPIPSNPFQAAKPPPLTINQLRSQNNFTLDNTFSNSKFLDTNSMPSQPVQHSSFNTLFDQPVNSTNHSANTSRNNPFSM